MKAQPRTSVHALTQLHPSLWRAHQLGSSQGQTLCTGFSELNKHLPGNGWAGNQCTELLSQHNGIGELRLLIPSLRTLALKKKRIVLVNPPFIPNPNVFKQYGISPHHMTLVKTNHEQQAAWATEKLIQSNSFGALLAWLPEKKTLLPHSQLKRLQNHAHASSGISFIFRPARASVQPSPAPLRLELTAYGLHQIQIDILKRKGPLMPYPLVLDLPLSGSALSHEPNQSQEFMYAMDRDLFASN